MPTRRASANCKTAHFAYYALREGGAVTDLFLSYKAEDRARVAPLVAALESDGLSVWWDAHIGGGDDWRDTILRHLEAAKCVIVVWSKRSVGPNGNFVRDEASRAQKRKTYFPVRIDKVDPPLGFGETQALDLNGWKGDRSDPRYQAVLGALRKRLGIKPRRSKSTQEEESKGLSRRAVIGTGAAAAVAVAGAGSWIFLRRDASHSGSIAVLPFANLSGDPGQAYFSDGIAEELRSALSRIAGLKVVARTSSEAVRNDESTTAAKKLHVDNILTGSVRQSPSTIRISAQLIDGESGIERWSENYDRAPGDTIKIQTDIAEKVAQSLSAALADTARAAATIGGTRNAAAQNLLLQADALMRDGTREELKTAQSLTDAALALDPQYADAMVLRGRVLNRYANTYANATELPQYREQALKDVRTALRVAPELASAHLALAGIYQGTLDFRDADREYRLALERSPSSADTIRDYAQFSNRLGRSPQSLALSAKALALDPLNSDSYIARFKVLWGNRSFEEALRFSRQLEQKFPDSHDWRVEVAMCLVLLGRVDDAKRYLQRVPADNADRMFGEAIIQARAHDARGVQDNVDKLFARFGDASSYQYAEIYAQLGDTDRAFAALDRAVELRDSGLVWLKVDPLLDPLRGTPRFQALFRRLDFPT
jgi:serine/threonine-protein kinase